MKSEIYKNENLVCPLCGKELKVCSECKDCGDLSFKNPLIGMKVSYHFLDLLVNEKIFIKKIKYV